MAYRDKAGTNFDIDLTPNGTGGVATHLRQTSKPHNLHLNPHWRSHSEPLGLKVTHNSRRPLTTDNEITHVSDSEEDLELLRPMSATSQSTYLTRLNSVLPTFTMEDDYLTNNDSGTVQSQLSNENFHCVDFALGSDERYCAGDIPENETRCTNRGSSLSVNDGLLKCGSAGKTSADHTSVSNDGDDDDVILIGSSQVVTKEPDSSIFNSEMERNIDFGDEDTTEELDKRELLKDVVDYRILSPIHEQNFDPNEIERCSTPVADETKIKKESEFYICGGKVELVSSLYSDNMKKEEVLFTDVKIEPTEETKLYKKTRTAKPFDVKQEYLQSETGGGGAMNLKIEQSLKKARVSETKPMIESMHLNNAKHDTKDAKAKTDQLTPRVSAALSTSDFFGQENKQPMKRVLKRKRIASKPLSAIVNTPKTRVGLSKRIRVEPLHENIKKRNP